MTQTTPQPRSEVDLEQQDRPTRPSSAGGHHEPVAAPAARAWWRRPWFLVAAVVSIAFVVYVLPPYLTLDPHRSRIPINPNYPFHYQLLVAHVFCGSIAILTVPLQVWGWLRRRHPKVHRVTGRVYVFCGAIPAGLLALAITPPSIGQPGNAVTGIMWLSVTITGFVMARKRRYVAHRRWMIYSFALCYTIVWGRIGLAILPLIPGYQLAWSLLAAQTATWIGFALNLPLAQWWLERTKKRARAVRATV